MVPLSFAERGRPPAAAWRGCLALALLLPALGHAQSDSIAPTGPDSIVHYTFPAAAYRTLVDTGKGRARAVVLSDGYYTRLHVHLVASYTALPIMATEYFLGEKLLSNERNGIRNSGGLVGAHVATAVGLTALFGLNTVTGVLNLYEARHVPEGRARRIIHSIMMLVADGGFAYTASLGGAAQLPRSSTGQVGTALPGADRHKQAAVISISIATAATVMMWLWKN